MQLYRNLPNFCRYLLLIFHLQDEGSRFIWNVGNFLPDYTMSQ